MGIKAALKAVGRLPGVSQMLRIPLVRGIVAKLTGIGRISPWDRVHPFDVAYGTDTSGFVPIRDQDLVEHRAASVQAIPYAGSQPSIVRTALATLPKLASFTFVDLGCGKGRPLLVASEYPFRDIVGVEFSAPLAQIAKQNADLIARRFPQRTPIRVVIGDASRFPLPAGDLVLFLYNPFGSELIARVAQAVDVALSTAGRTVFVVYYNPVAGHCFDASTLLRRYFAGTLAYAADELGYGPDSEDPVVIWHGGLGAGPTDARANARIEIIDARDRVKLVQR